MKKIVCILTLSLSLLSANDLEVNVNNMQATIAAAAYTMGHKSIASEDDIWALAAFLASYSGEAWDILNYIVDNPGSADPEIVIEAQKMLNIMEVYIERIEQ